MKRIVKKQLWSFSICLLTLLNMSVLQPVKAEETIWYLKQKSEHIGNIELFLAKDKTKVVCKDAGYDFYLFPTENKVFIANSKRNCMYSGPFKNWHPQLTTRVIFGLDMGIFTGVWINSQSSKRFGLNVLTMEPDVSHGGKKVDKLLVTKDIADAKDVTRTLWELYVGTPSARTMPSSCFPIEFVKQKPLIKLRTIFTTLECKKIRPAVKVFEVPKLRPVKKELDIYLMQDTLNNLLDTAGINHE